MEAEVQKENSGFPASALWPAFALFAAVAAIWLYCLPPGLAPYRDAGEMACDVYTLGIPHPPGYPLYVITAKIFSLIAPGNFAYRLNLFSALSGLSVLMFLYFTFVRPFGAPAAFLAVFLFALNFTTQTVSSVSEMYALNLFFAAVLMKLALTLEAGGTPPSLGGRPEGNLRRIWLIAFLLGLAMTNRMDIVLMAPAILAAALPELRKNWRRGFWTKASWTAAFWLAGFSLYLYLPVRSGSNPLFDWSHPADMNTFLAVITRKSYGSTLDLISKNYAAGELFWPNLKYYALHLWDNFNIALVFAAAGAYREFRTDKRRFLFTLALFSFAGVIFLFMANMPPNPHALAIVEPNYLMPDLAVVLWTAAGLSYAFRHFQGVRYGAAFAAVAALSLAAYHNLPHSNRRQVFAAEDWARDAMRSAPPGSSLVAKKDVQIFTLWYLQTVRGERPDLKLVPQGLSGSKWFMDSKGLWRPDLKLFNLNSGEAAEWKNFSEFNSGGAYASMDAELPKETPAMPRGILNALYPGETFFDMWRFLNFRWLGADYNDFFCRDLGTSYAQSIVAGAAYLNTSGGLNAGDAARLELARVMDEDLADAPLYAGFYYSKAGDWPRAAAYFQLSARVYGRLSGLADKYYALPSLKESLARSSAYSWLNYGVALEKTGNPAGAENAYRRALAGNPKLADAHYNMAILYWNKDKNRVYQELKTTLELNPAHQQAAYYLGRMQAKEK
ncbi:MAG: DUF2723 domain-containing protein [Elusimicrobia bacterium]|nr:DUF2723 domain-containing protein [Elusimicrobiota bacterium]